MGFPRLRTISNAQVYERNVNLGTPFRQFPELAKSNAYRYPWPMVVLYHSVLTLSPPIAEPLLPAPETNAYNIWLKPCGPGLVTLEVPKPLTDETPVNTSITRGKTSATSMAIFTS